MLPGPAAPKLEDSTPSDLPLLSRRSTRCLDMLHPHWRTARRLTCHNRAGDLCATWTCHTPAGRQRTAWTCRARPAMPERDGLHNNVLPSYGLHIHDLPSHISHSLHCQHVAGHLPCHAVAEHQKSFAIVAAHLNCSIAEVGPAVSPLNFLCWTMPLLLSWGIGLLLDYANTKQLMLPCVSQVNIHEDCLILY